MTGFAVQLLRLLRKDRDELPADPLSFLFWIGDAFELAQKTVRRIHADNVQA